MLTRIFLAAFSITILMSCRPSISEEEQKILTETEQLFEWEIRELKKEARKMLYQINEDVYNTGRRSVDVKVLEQSMSLYGEYLELEHRINLSNELFPMDSVNDFGNYFEVEIEANRVLATERNFLPSSNIQLQYFLILQLRDYLLELRQMVGSHCICFDTINLGVIEDRDSVDVFLTLNFGSNYLVESLIIPKSINDSLLLKNRDPWVKVEYTDSPDTLIEVGYITEQGVQISKSFSGSSIVSIY